MKSLLSRYRPGFSKAHFYRELRKDLHMAQHFAWAKEIGADAIAEGILTIHLDRCQRRANARFKRLSCWWPKKYRPACRKYPG